MQAMLSEIQSDLEKIETTIDIGENTNFNFRIDSIDFIDFYIIDRVEGLLQTAGQCDDLRTLRLRANQVQSTLETINTTMFHRLERQMNASSDKRLTFQKILDDYRKDATMQSDNEQSNNEQLEAVGYDNFDVFINNLLSTSTIIEAEKTLEPEMIYYQKTPARIIMELCKKVHRNDVFFDIGSGLGQVVILVNLMSGAQSIGVEFEPSYCQYAKDIVSKFALTDIEFINADARAVDYSIGTVFFFYTPFIGKMMQDVLGLLQKLAQKKEIRICTYGHCTIKIAQESWLHCIYGNADNIYNLCEFKSVPFDALSVR
jgi:SAM-dependent methyltransferase